MSHDSAPAPDPVPLTLGMPAAPARPRGLTDGLLRERGTSASAAMAGRSANPDAAHPPATTATATARASSATPETISPRPRGISATAPAALATSAASPAGTTVPEDRTAQFDTDTVGPEVAPADSGTESDPSAVPVLDLALPDERVADFLAEIAHADTGFVARTESGDRALAVVAGTAAALCGMDIRAALAAPDLEFLRGLRPAAVQAVREVLLAVECADPGPVTRGLAPLADVRSAETPPH
ncbi:hypothetical protein [Nocardia aurantia]|uniref:Uncharacterized protein n=1 Tax=Nocardia aurantia TaxID=2585199 RepID=A0A7K0DQ49_9NOCA|nr:hypothetical protein [Nocardia aurantia]MQY26944.1 hypothetical protein [Nocardia aurantia]